MMQVLDDTSLYDDNEGFDVNEVDIDEEDGRGEENGEDGCVQ